VRARARRSSIAVVVLVLAAALAPQRAIAQEWAGYNIGDPALHGTAAALTTDCVGSTPSCFGVSIYAAGADIWGSWDQFVFVSTPLSGDGSIVARVRDLQESDPWAKAGLMMRETLAGGSRHASIFASASRGVAFQRRPDTDGASVHTGGSGSTAPVWLKLERSGTTITAYESADGHSWTLVGQDTLAVGGEVQVGVAVTSHNPWAHAAATITDVSVTTGGSTGGTPGGTPGGENGGTTVPADWSFASVGGPALAGGVAAAGNSFSVAGAGADVWDGWDQFSYVYRQIAGDADIVTRVSYLNAAHPWTKAGLMVRNSLDGNSAHAFAMVSGGRGASFQGRTQDGGYSQQFGNVDGAAPAWLRIERRGAVINAYVSPDGGNWTSLGSAAIGLYDTVYVGLAVTSHSEWQMADAGFDSISIQPVSAAGNRAPNVTVTSPWSGSGFDEPATVTISADASDSDGSIGWVEFYANGAYLGSASSAPYTLQWSGVSAGSYSVTAKAFDDRGEASVSSPVWFSVAAAPVETTPPPPQSFATRIAFTPSADHDSLVARYVFEVFAAGAGPGVGSPVASQDLGKPWAGGGEITADVTSTLQWLPSGNYVATVTAVGSSGVGVSEGAWFSR
jgi:regulation of enolase protein 1 (concanavalin A-like superfamily)